MESLPVELMFQIFDYVQELRTLSALVHASPSFHKIYAAHRAEIFTALTFRSLEARGILFTGHPMGWVEVCFTTAGSRFSREPLPEEANFLGSVLKKINLQLEKKSGGRSSFSVDECLILGKIMHMNAYLVAKRKDNSDCWTKKQMPEYPFSTESEMLIMWTDMNMEGRSREYPGGVHKYRLTIVNDYSPWERRWLQQFTGAMQSGTCEPPR